MPNDHDPSTINVERIQQLLRELPDLEPDPDFTSRLLRQLPARKPSLWLRFRLWATRPMTVRFTPARLFPATAVAIAALLVLRLVPFGPEMQPNTETAAAPDASARVHFVLQDDGRTLGSVAVLGSFNNWRADGFEMQYDQEARAWTLTAPLPRGSHEYVFLVNGAHTLPDPQAAFSKDDGFGQKNSILLVDDSHDL